MEKFKRGELIEVRDRVHEQWETHTFIVRFGSFFYCEPVRGDHLIPWSQARPIPEPIHSPYTYQTFPQGVVFVRNLQANRGELVLRIGKHFVYLSNKRVSYEQLANEYELSTDNCKTWQPARELETDENER